MPAGLATSPRMNVTTSHGPAAGAATTSGAGSATAAATPAAGHGLVDGAALRTVLAGGGVTLIDFTAAWCAPCKRLAPILDELRGAYGGRAGIVAVDVDAEPAVAQAFRVTSMPTMVLVRDGREVGRLVGLRRREVVAGAIDRALAGGVAITG
jgi:thioredoxin 1